MAVHYAKRYKDIKGEERKMKTKKRLGKFACALVIMAMTLGLAGEIPLFNGQEHVNAAER